MKKYTDEEILCDVKKVYNERPKGVKFTLMYYTTNGRFSSMVMSRLGGWNNVLTTLGIRLNVNHDVTKQDVIEDARSLYAEHGRLTADIQRKYGKYSQITVDKLFGSFTSMMLEAGYIPCDVAKSMSDDDLLDILRGIYEEHGYLSKNLIDVYSPVSSITYYNHFGSLTSVYDILGYNQNNLPIKSNLDLSSANRIIAIASSFLNEPALYEWKADWLRNPEDTAYLRVDGYFEKYNLAIEYDGQQHFEYIPFLHGGDVNKFKRQQDLDRHKDKLLKEHKIKVVRFKYDDYLTEKSIINKIKKSM